MRLIDITRELTEAPVYPGDPAPELSPLCRIAYGDACNTTAIAACLHNGTHLDAPLHFVPDGLAAADIPLTACIGKCSVVAHEGLLLGAEAERLLPGLRERVLFKGGTQISPSAAFVFADAGLTLLGVEAPSVAPPECTAAVHRQLLGAGVLLLEGLDLTDAAPGEYRLLALPLRIAGADGTPVRAVLMEEELSV